MSTEPHTPELHKQEAQQKKTYTPKAHTSAFGLLGKTLGHSYSPLIHKTLGNKEYTLFEREPQELTAFFADLSLQGLNVTIPYKQTALQACAELSPIAKRMGGVNTMIRRSTGWYGHNTDYEGFLYMIKRAGITVAGKKVVILGDGATAHMVHMAIEDQHAHEIIHLSRKNPPFYKDASSVGKNAQLLINTTPVGMYPNCPEQLVNLDDFPALEAVVDVIYNPYRTALLIDAETKGLLTSDGLPMLVGQAVGSARLFQNRDFSDDEIEELINEIRYKQENIVLVGMPGVGKTTVARELAKVLQRPVIDCDAIFEERHGHPSTYIATHGEADFREKETAILRDISKETGLIIATGGGVITRPENFNLLRQNGRLYWLRRPLEILDTEGRVLSHGGLERLEQLFKVRKPLYEAFAQCEINYVTPEDGAQQIADEYNTHYKN